MFSPSLIIISLIIIVIYRSIVENDGSLTNDIGGMVVPRVPIGVSGTALAASLLRDGWSVGSLIILHSFSSVKIILDVKFISIHFY